MPSNKVSLAPHRRQLNVLGRGSLVTKGIDRLEISRRGMDWKDGLTILEFNVSEGQQAQSHVNLRAVKHLATSYTPWRS